MLGVLIYNIGWFERTIGKLSVNLEIGLFSTQSGRFKHIKK
jgi:hypothetical protein